MPLGPRFGLEFRTPKRFCLHTKVRVCLHTSVGPGLLNGESPRDQTQSSGSGQLVHSADGLSLWPRLLVAYQWKPIISISLEFRNHKKVVGIHLLARNVICHMIDQNLIYQISCTETIEERYLTSPVLGGN